jgi:hypothetical protein
MTYLLVYSAIDWRPAMLDQISDIMFLAMIWYFATGLIMAFASVAEPLKQSKDWAEALACMVYGIGIAATWPGFILYLFIDSIFAVRR